MAYVPPDAKWYLAEIVLVFTIEDQAKPVVHINTKLVSAHSPQRAYEKALAIGRTEEAEYINTDGKKVSARFRGLRDLLVIYEELKDGAEIMYEEIPDMEEDQINRLITPKADLGVFG